ncbi:hypothetical protein KSP40_PGU007101 [Platanthera guangdongensis]|uniref:Uncharacterized protein n=1 Tax=Platanthera guangdongensis TaxID=2320717 RepID=A0ABR2M7H1_9ASPA
MEDRTGRTVGPSSEVYKNEEIRTQRSREQHKEKLVKLYLNANDLSDENISWDGISQLKSLTILSFNQNK